VERESQELLEHVLPRGLPFGRDQQNRSERAEWASVEEIEGLKYKPGDILLGKFNGQRLGYTDDKPMVTVASARSGKSSTVIIPTLLTYPARHWCLIPRGSLPRRQRNTGARC
jgi:type IV secretory pathway TraG/TraD family ATPase VirD4